MMILDVYINMYLMYFQREVPKCNPDNKLKFRF